MLDERPRPDDRQKPRRPRRPRSERARPAPELLDPRRADGAVLGPYETSYPILHGYTTERTIVRP